VRVCVRMCAYVCVCVYIYIYIYIKSAYIVINKISNVHIT